MCLELMSISKLRFGVVASASDIAMLLEMAGVAVLADTINTYWTAEQRTAALDWACAKIAEREVGQPILIPPLPEVLRPFFDVAKREKWNLEYAEIMVQRGKLDMEQGLGFAEGSDAEYDALMTPEQAVDTELAYWEAGGH